MASDTVWKDSRKEQRATKPPGFFQKLRDTWRNREEERETTETFNNVRTMISRANAATRSEPAQMAAVQRAPAPIVEGVKFVKSITEVLWHDDGREEVKRTQIGKSEIGYHYRLDTLPNAVFNKGPEWSHPFEAQATAEQAAARTTAPTSTLWEIEKVRQHEIVSGKQAHISAQPQTSAPEQQQVLDFWQRTAAQASSVKQPQRAAESEIGMEL